MAVPECLADRYEVRELLGRGGMGDVYDGWDRRLERRVAIKVLNSELAAHSDIRVRFEHEARSAAMLVNSKVVAVYDTGEHDGVPYIVMERLPGKTLADELAEGPLPQKRVRAILLDMLEAVAAAHDAGIIHRDIKPSNVLLTASGTAKIADFGIAKSTEQNLTQTGSLVGTAAYLSPERVMGSPAGPGSDIYSIGVVAFEALTGRTPFHADTPLGLVRAIMDDPVPPIRSLVPTIEEDLAGAIDKATHKLPEHRFSSARAMAAALQPASGRAGIPAEPTTPSTGRSEPAGRTLTLATRTAVDGTRAMSPRNRALLAGAAALVLLLAIVRFNANDSPGPATPPATGPAPTGPASPESRPGGGSEVPIAGVASVDFLGPGTLRITKGPESLRIEAPDELLGVITSEVTNGKLTLGTRPGNQPPGVGEVVYHLSLDRLGVLQATGSGSIEAEGIDEPSFRFAGLGSADASVVGQAGELDLSLAGSGNFDGSRLKVSRAVAELSGSGDAKLAVSDTLRAELSGSGSVDYTGDPQVTQQAFGSGRVRKAG